MSNEAGSKDRSLVPSNQGGLLKKSPGLLRRGIDLAKTLNNTLPQVSDIAFLLTELDKAESEEDWERVIELGEQILKLDPNHQGTCEKLFRTYLYHRGMNYYSASYYQQAIYDFTRAIEFKSDTKLVYFLRGYAYKELGNYQQAIYDFTRAIELDPFDTGSYHSRGVANYKLKNYDQAIEDYSRDIEVSTKLYRDKALAYYDRGLAYQAKGNHLAAGQDFLKAIELGYTALIYGISDYNMAAKYEQAIQDYTKTIEFHPSYAWTYYNRGLAYHQLTNYDQAINDYTKAIELDANNKWAYYNRALAYYQSFDHDQALYDYSQAIELDANFNMAYYNRGLVYEDIGDNIAAEQDFNKAKKLGYREVTQDNEDIPF